MHPIDQQYIERNAAYAAYAASAATLKKIDCKIKQLLGIRRTR